MQVAIIGAGIGGLTTALMLFQRGIKATIFEAATEIRELGVGINVLPHAIKELSILGLLPRLDAVGIRTKKLIYANRFGQEIWSEPRGMDAGFDVPQFSIHRGKLQGLLRDAVLERLGSSALCTGYVFKSFEEDEGGVTANFVNSTGKLREAHCADVLIGCDGIHSTVCKQLHPDTAGMKWNGIMMWRGAAELPSFLGGNSMIIAGGFANKLVIYPISPGSKPGSQLINWVISHRSGDGSVAPARRADWHNASTLQDVLPFMSQFKVSQIDLEQLIRATKVFYEYPMTDRDPLMRWTFGRVTLLGDAAHAMYPVGSNGASQSIIDARVLTDCLVSAEHPRAALLAYQADRLPKTTEIVYTNRSGGPEGVIDEVERRSPNGFTHIDDVISYEERHKIVRGYAAMAGFTAAQVNA